MFDTQIGPTGTSKGYLRPETAQGMFVNFKKLLEYNNDHMPFAAAQIGKSFRNEISPRSGLLRVREFTMAEIEHFVHPEKKQHPRFSEVADCVFLKFLPAHVQEAGSDKCLEMSIGEAVKTGLVNNETLGYFLARIYLFLVKIGVKRERLRFRQHMSTEMAHYACDCWDAEIHNSYGWIECVGCADRSAYDLTKHTEATSERLVARDRLETPRKITKLKFNFNRKELGITFKKDSSLIIGYFEAMDERERTEWKVKLDDGSHGDDIDVTISGTKYTVKRAHVSIVQVTETLHVDEYIPSVIEPSFGIGRILYSLLEHSYWVRPESSTNDDDKDEKNERRVLSFPCVVAPTKCVILPLSANDLFKPCIELLRTALRKRNVSFQVDD